MPELIHAAGLGKRYGRVQALTDLNLSIPAGRIVGLIGPNGAGKSTLLKSILGLLRFDGELTVLGLDPHRERAAMLEQVSYIADVATLPDWIRVHQLLEYCSQVHPRFRREKAEAFLAKTELKPDFKVARLSKGMKTQLHLALVMAIDARLLVLDEPTLGLDILYRKAFHSSLVTDFFDEERTILISTHQVEEVEHILTDLLFIRQGRIVLNLPMDEVPGRFAQLVCGPDSAAAARELAPLREESLLGRHVFLYDGVSRERLAPLGELRTPGVADLFVGLMGEGGAA
ncbi:MAG: ABC transporter ATP-binding protein [Candidatus Delongbacteria bacterium]